MTDTDEIYIAVEEAADLLQVAVRTVNRYGNEGRIKVRQAGRRVLYHRGDVESLAKELGTTYKPKPKPPQMEIMPPGEVLNYVQQKDAEVRELHNRMHEMMYRIGQLETQLTQRLLPEDVEELKQKLAQVEAERNTLQTELEKVSQRKTPWWKRLFGQNE